MKTFIKNNLLLLFLYNIPLLFFANSNNVNFLIILITLSIFTYLHLYLSHYFIVTSEKELKTINSYYILITYFILFIYHLGLLLLYKFLGKELKLIIFINLDSNLFRSGLQEIQVLVKQL